MSSRSRWSELLRRSVSRSAATRSRLAGERFSAVGQYEVELWYGFVGGFCAAVGFVVCGDVAGGVGGYVEVLPGAAAYGFEYGLYGLECAAFAVAEGGDVAFEL